MKPFGFRASMLVALPVLLIAGAAVLKIYQARPTAPAAPRKAIHFYQKSSVNIEKIGVKVFYAVPRDRFSEIYPGWRALLSGILGEAAEFHKLQFHVRSEFSYEIFSDPLILRHDGSFYDTDDTNKGNPEALTSITAEIKTRAESFLKKQGDEFTVIAIVYEGVGASGTDGAMILSRTFLSDPQYADSASALFYHEFGHTIGLPDRYDLLTNQPFSGDIMGSGRYRPLNVNYLDAALLAEMNAATQ